MKKPNKLIYTSTLGWSQVTHAVDTVDQQTNGDVEVVTGTGIHLLVSQKRQVYHETLTGNGGTAMSRHIGRQARFV